MEIVLSHNYRNKDINNVLHKESEACFPMYVFAKKNKNIGPKSSHCL